MRRLVVVSCLLGAAGVVLAAGAQPLPLSHRYDLPSTCAALTMTTRHDAEGRPFLYVAAKQGGLRVYDVAAAPRLVRTIPVTALRSLHVMSLAQAGNRLFLALGNHFPASQSPGVAVVDVSDPKAARVLHVWSDPALRAGAGVIATAGRYVYLGAMRDGLVTLSVVAKTGKLRRLSGFVPPIAFPDANPDPPKFNARGLALRGDLLYLAYDAGGVRVIDVADPRHPREIGRYSNPALNGQPRAYNNLVLDGDLAYVTVDYCGLEVLDVGDPERIAQVAWWKPWQCPGGLFTWLSSPGHTNEIDFDPACRLVFLSAGRSDLQVLSVADPAHPELRGSWGAAGDQRATWGVSRFGDEVYLSYICTLGIPFAANWSGVTALRYDRSGCGGD